MPKVIDAELERGSNARDRAFQASAGKSTRVLEEREWEAWVGHWAERSLLTYLSRRPWLRAS